MSRFTNRSGKLRFYDGTATPYYLELKFDSGDFSAPSGTPLNDEELVLDRNKMTSDAHYIEGPDTRKMEPVELTFTALLEDTTITTYLLDWLKSMRDGRTTQVNSNPLESTQGDTQRDGSNANPTFADSNKSTCNVEYMLDGVVDVAWHYNEVWFSPSDQVVTESDDSVALALRGMVYGTVVRDTAFTPGGVDVTA